MFSKSGKHFANPAIGRMHDRGSEPSKESEKGGPANEPAASGDQGGHTSQTHGTVPHPVTGVHAVHIHNHEGGKAKTHTHHDGGHIETRDHANLQEAHDHAQQMLPPDGVGGEPDADDRGGGGNIGDVAPLGEMMGGGGY